MDGWQSGVFRVVTPGREVGVRSTCRWHLQAAARHPAAAPNASGAEVEKPWYRQTI